MYQNAAMLAASFLIYSAVAGRIERSWISGPIVFVGVGFILGPDALGVLRLNITGEGLRTSGRTHIGYGFVHRRCQRGFRRPQAQSGAFRSGCS